MSRATGVLIVYGGMNGPLESERLCRCVAYLLSGVGFWQKPQEPRFSQILRGGNTLTSGPTLFLGVFGLSSVPRAPTIAGERCLARTSLPKFVPSLRSSGADRLGAREIQLRSIPLPYQRHCSVYCEFAKCFALDTLSCDSPGAANVPLTVTAPPRAHAHGPPPSSVTAHTD